MMTMANGGRDGDGGNGEADGLPLAAAGTADRIAHQQQLRNVAHAQPGAAEALADAELALQGNAARHLFELWLADSIGCPKGVGDGFSVLSRHRLLPRLVACRLGRRQRPESQRVFHSPEREPERLFAAARWSQAAAARVGARLRDPPRRVWRQLRELPPACQADQPDPVEDAAAGSRGPMSEGRPRQGEEAEAL